MEELCIDKETSGTFIATASARIHIPQGQQEGLHPFSSMEYQQQEWGIHLHAGLPVLKEVQNAEVVADQMTIEQEMLNNLDAAQKTIGDGKISLDEIRTMVELGVLAGTAFISAILTWFTTKVLRRKKMERKKKRHSLINDKLGMFMYERLLYLRIKSGASRTRICMFHNGGEYFSGVPMHKFSCTHESSAKGISNESENIQNCLVTVFLDKMKMISKNTPEIFSVESLESESKTKNVYKSSEVEYFSILPIHKNSITIGYIEVEWNDDPIPSLVLDFDSLFTMTRSQIELELTKEED